MKLSEMCFADGAKPICIKDGVNITDEIERGDGKGNPFGWSSSNLYHVQNIGGAEVRDKVGSIYCGGLSYPASGYQFFVKFSDGTTKVWDMTA